MVKEKPQKKGSDVIMEYNFDEVVPEVVIEENEKVCEEEKREKRKILEKKKDIKRVCKTKGRLVKEEELKEKIEASVGPVIQELLDSEKTFVENITRNARKSALSSFYPFPKNISFLSVGKEEAVVLVVRHHWFGLVPKVFLALFTFLFPFLLSMAVDNWFEGSFGTGIFILGLFVFFTMLTVTILLDSFLKWFFEMNMITTKRVIDVDFVSVMNHRVSETTFDQVQDVSHSPAGPLAAIFDYGHLYLQTAGAKCEFEFNNIPRPRDVQDTILDLRELRRKKIAKGD